MPYRQTKGKSEGHDSSLAVAYQEEPGKPELSTNEYPDLVLEPEGHLNFQGFARLSPSGVEFEQGHRKSYQCCLQDFQVLEEIGQGTFATVHKVFHLPSATLMAFKALKLELEDRKLRSIQVELDVLRRSRSPYIIHFYGAFFIESTVYLCLEWCEGGSLEKLYMNGVSEDILAKIALSCVKGLQYLQTMDIVHRDVKPANILVNERGQFKLCDFGISAKLKNREKDQAKPIVVVADGEVIATHSYMAPEWLAGESYSTAYSSGRSNGNYSTESDIWSLGLTLVEIGTGQYPYPRSKEFDSLFARLQAIIDLPPPNLPSTTFSTESRDFIANCLAKSPSDRPNYNQLLNSAWLLYWEGEDVDVAPWVKERLQVRNALTFTRQEVKRRGEQLIESGDLPPPLDED